MENNVDFLAVLADAIGFDLDVAEPVQCESCRIERRIASGL